MADEVADPERIDSLIEMTTQNISSLFADMNKLGSPQDTPFLRKNMDHVMDQTHKFIRSARQQCKARWEDPTHKANSERRLDDAERTFLKLEQQINRRQDEALGIAPDRANSAPEYVVPPLAVVHSSCSARAVPASVAAPASAAPSAPANASNTFDFSQFRSHTELPHKFVVAVQNDHNLYFNVIPGPAGKTVGGYEKQLWEFTAREDETWNILSVPANRFVTAECKIGFLYGPVTCRCPPAAVKTFERWQIHSMPEKPNTFALKSFHGYYMTISKDGEVYAAQKAPVDACALHFVKP